MSNLKLILIALGGLLVFMAYEESKLTGVASETPREMTVAELYESGPGDNAHVLLDEFLFATDFVYESDKGSWSKVWVPALPLNGTYHQEVMAMLGEDDEIPEGAVLPSPTDVRLLVKSSHVDDMREFEELADRDRIGGLIVNEIESLGGDERKLLQESYPTIDFDRCWILDHDRKPKTMAGVAGLGAGGVGLLGVGLAWTIAGARSKDEEALAEDEAAEA